MNIHAIGQNMMLGKIRASFVILSFATSAGSLFSLFLRYIKQNETKINSVDCFWQKMYVLHAVSVFGVMASLLILIHTHSFEYKYVWEHTSKSLPFIINFQPCGADKREYVTVDVLAWRIRLRVIFKAKRMGKPLYCQLLHWLKYY